MIHPIRSKIVLLAAFAVLPATGLFAQAPDATPTPSVSAPAATDTTTSDSGKHHKKDKKDKHSKTDSTLTAEEHAKLSAAHKKAMEDPAVKAAEPTKATDPKGYGKVMHEAMLRADPSIAPILDKMHQESGKDGKKKKKDKGGSGDAE